MTQRLSALWLLLLVCSCASSAPPTSAPHLTSVPPVVLEALCARLAGEGISGAVPMSVVSRTQPLVTAASVRSLAHAYSLDTDGVAAAESINAGSSPLAVDIAGSKSCAWTTIDRIDAERDAQATIVELSAPFTNPFARGQGGVLARVSIGGHDAQWYWVPLAERAGAIGVGTVMPLMMHDV